MGELEAGLDEALAGRGSLFLLAGEPGVGKTRLADALCVTAAKRGALALWGRCWEGGGAPAYWPWAQVARACAREQDPAAIVSAVGPAASTLAQFVPELSDHVPEGAEAPVSLESQNARFAFFDAFTTFLSEASRDRPLVIVLDDLHAADEPSLLLLEFLARELRRTNILVIGTYRAVEAKSGARRMLGQLVRFGQLVPLGGLREEAIAKLVEDRSGARAPEETVSALRELTEGNPLFLDEVLRLMTTEGALRGEAPVDVAELPIPEGVRETIRRRVDPLDAEVGALLRVAAVFGKNFSVTALEGASGEPRNRVLELLDEASAAGLIAADPGAVGRYRFEHGLIRDVLYEDLPALDRAKLHARAGEVRERMYADDPEPHLAELAHHFLESATAGNLDKAIDYSGRAGDRALGVLAPEEAIGHFERALQALELADAPDPSRRFELLMSLGTAERISGDRDQAKETFRRGSELARDDAARQARAALSYAGRYWTPGVVDEQTVAMLESALEALGPEGSTLRAATLSRLATELYYSPDRERANALSAEAVEVARGLDDPGALAVVLDNRLGAAWAPDNLDERLELANQVVELAERASDRTTALRGRAFHVTCLLERGEISKADRELNAATQIAQDLRQPRFLWHVTGLRALRALMEGHFEEAERLADEALESGRLADERSAIHYHGIQVFTVRRGQGRLEGLAGPMKAFVDAFPALPAWRCTLAHLYNELGRTADARTEFDRAAANGWADLPFDSSWLLGVSVAADLCAALGDTDRAPALYEQLLPYVDRNVVLGRVPSISIGSAARYAGLVAALMERFDEAEQHFESAIEMNGRMGARPWTAQTRFDLARMLVRRDSRGDGERAGELLDAVLGDAESLGMATLAERARMMRERPGEVEEPEREQVADSGGEATPADAGAGAARATSTAVFRRQGDYWTVGFGDSESMVRDVKGLRYIAELLRHPGTEFHATDLARSAEGRAVPSSTTAAAAEDAGAPGAEDAGAVLDDEAKAAYKARLDDLREELEEAESFSDLERAARAREEMEFLAHELAGAVGLGGRDRKAASTSERARVNVTRTIRLAIQKIAASDSRLAGHLDTGIRTGTFCSYSPDPAAPVEWEL